MNKIYTTEYKIYMPQRSGIKIGIINDLHFSSKISNQKLNVIKEKIKNAFLDYLLFPGDLVDHIGTVQDSSERNRLLFWLQDLGEICRVLISLGNHDFYKESQSRQWVYYMDEVFWNSVNHIKGVHVLNNEQYEDDQVHIVGITQPFDYYHPSNSKREDKNRLMEMLYSIRSLLCDLPVDKLNLAMIHCPMYLTDQRIQCLLKEFDYFITGHMHNGCIPPMLDELWNSTRGLISPDNSLFPKNARNTLKYRDDKLLVNGALTTFHECSGPLEKLNFLFPIYMSFMEFTDDCTYNHEKIDISKKYEKFHVSLTATKETT